MKRFVTALALACAFSASAFAGDVPTGDNVPPAPTITSEATPGDTPTGGYTQDAATDLTLTVVQIIISVLSI